MRAITGWGTSRHGTNSGWKRHQTLGERPCDACFRAKSEYDKQRLASTDKQLKNRLNAKAQGRALQRLSRAHPDEYAMFYKQEKWALMHEEAAS